MNNLTLVAVLIVALAGCQNLPEEKGDNQQIILTEIKSPAKVSGQPNLFASKSGDIYLSWIEKLNDSTNALKFSRLENDIWLSPKIISTGTNWFVNWADFPSLVAFKGSTEKLAAHWLQMRAQGTYDYDVRIAQSGDGGETWSESFIPHKDGIAAEHGFVSMVTLGPDRVMAVWLDGRFTKTGNAKPDDHGHGHGGPMTLRTANFDPEGNLYEETELDNKVCDCCQTAAALTSAGPVVVYRDRSDSEVRDISVVRKVNGQWTEPYPVHNDNWEIAACPVNGPAIAASDNTVAVAWFTMENNKGVVKLAFSNNAGARFKSPVVVDADNPIGRVDVVLLSGERAFITWMESSGELMGAIVKPEGLKANPVKIALSDASRKSGFPVLAKSGQDIIVAWTRVGDSPKVKTARIVLK